MPRTYRRKFLRHTKMITQEDLAAMPEYASKSEWLIILHVAEETWRKAVRNGKFEVDVDNGRVSATKKEVLKWYAPSLYKEVYPNSFRDYYGEDVEKEAV